MPMSAACSCDDGAAAVDSNTTASSLVRNSSDASARSSASVVTIFGGDLPISILSGGSMVDGAGGAAAPDGSSVSCGALTGAVALPSASTL